MPLSLGLLVSILIFLIFCSMFFAAAETSMIALNRYRLRHLVKQGHRAAKRAQQLLDHPDRLLGMVLIANTCANIFSASITTIIAEYYFGHIGIAIGTGCLTLVLLVLAEIAPKTLAAMHPEPIAFMSSLPLKYILKLFYPLVWFVNVLSNGVLRLFGVKFTKGIVVEHLSTEELRSIVYEAGGKIPAGHRDMLLRILELERVRVEDIMVPRTDIVGIDLESNWELNLHKISHSNYTKIPVYRGDIQHIIGLLHIRDVVNLTEKIKLTPAKLISIVREVYFVPEGTPLHIQLLNFRRRKIRTGFVVDEYGEILGLLTLEDILEEIVGEFTTDIAAIIPDATLQSDGSYWVDGGANIRDLNRTMHWHFDTDGPKTLSGLIIENLQAMPESGICLRVSGYPIEIIKVKGNTVKTARILPANRSL